MSTLTMSEEAEVSKNALLCSKICRSLEPRKRREKPDDIDRTVWKEGIALMESIISAALVWEKRKIPDLFPNAKGLHMLSWAIESFHDGHSRLKENESYAEFFLRYRETLHRLESGTATAPEVHALSDFARQLGDKLDSLTERGSCGF